MLNERQFILMIIMLLGNMKLLAQLLRCLALVSKVPSFIHGLMRCAIVQGSLPVFISINYDVVNCLEVLQLALLT